MLELDPKHMARGSVALLAAAAVLWAITGKVGAGASLGAVGVLFGVITMIVSARRKP